MPQFKDAQFGKGKVSVDGCKFVGCKFIDTILVYAGGEHPTFDRCSFIRTNWLFDGPAGNTLQFIHGLYQSPFKPIVDNMIDYFKGEKDLTEGAD